MKKRSIVFALLFCASLFCQTVAWRVNTIAGVFPLGNDGPGVNALLGRPRHLTFDGNGNLYIADTDNHQIRRLGRDGRIVAIAGTAIEGNSGDGGPALQADLNRPRAVAIDGNQLFIADSGNYRVRVVNLETGIIEAYAGLGVGRDETTLPAIDWPAIAATGDISRHDYDAVDERMIWMTCAEGLDSLAAMARQELAAFPGTRAEG